MPGLSKTQRSAAERACLTLVGGGAGSLGTLAVAHSSTASVAIAVGVGAAITSLCAALPGIIAELKDKGVARIKTENDAQIALEAARLRTTLVNAGLEGNLDAATLLLKLQLLDTQMLVDPCFRDDILRALLPDPRTPCEADVRTIPANLDNRNHG
jgi:hypothetical protein